MGKTTKLERVAVSELIPYINNANQHSDDQVTRIASSIREFGFLNPVLIDADKNVIAGHGRILAAKKLGMEEVPAIYVEGLTEAQRKAYILADNRLGELSQWDMDLVQGELDALEEAGFDIDLIGFEIDMEVDDQDVTEDDFDKELPEEAISKVGELYKLGNHRLIVGDSTDPEVLNTLMGGEVADLYLTDPPYNVNYSNAAGSIANDNMENKAFREFLTDAFNSAVPHLRGGVRFLHMARRHRRLQFQGSSRRCWAPC